MRIKVADLVAHYEMIFEERMRGLPIVNERLAVEAVGFEQWEDQDLGILITPWFMNLVLLPGNDEWAENAQGDMSSIEFPSGPIEFITSRDDVLGTYLTAVLFRSVSDVPDQRTARELALRVMQDLFVPARSERSVSRRELLTGLRST